MKKVLDKFLKREKLSCSKIRDITECPDYWEKLAVVS